MLANKLFDSYFELSGSLVCSVALNDNVIAAGCADGTVHVLETKTGQHIVPALVLSKPTAKISVSKPAWVMCVTTNGYVTVWDMITKSVVVSSESIAPVSYTHLDVYKRQP